MTNRTIIPSQAVWKGTMVLGGVPFKGKFKVFDSNGGWACLFGKPLMQATCATHDFQTDVVRICSMSNTISLSNQINSQAAECAMTLGVSLTLDIQQWGTKKGGSSGRNPFSRQVSSPQKNVTTKQIDKHRHIAEF
jgi:hypothetical protein